jgi:hypothetical protein
VTYLLWASLAHAADAQSVRVQVLLRDAPAAATPYVTTTWLGAARSFPLSDDGSEPGDKAGDHVYVGHLSGAVVRVLPVAIGVTTADGPETLAAFNEVLGEGDNDLAYEVTLGSTGSVRRVAAAWSSRSAEVAELARTGASIGWAALVLGYVAWLVGRSPAPR